MAVLRINLDWGSPWNPIVVAPWVAASRKVKMDLTPSLKHEYPVAGCITMPADVAFMHKYLCKPNSDPEEAGCAAR
ncbi:hypothetical protein HZH68_002443 [Vespula germanica]|uniref:Uncharacterized protein n=1 Tax=Vespula germanica TaxID=30212 RepID=A0A834U072_VESGE|nr:hypothetical protein HZH68_002443 [Vespula germanica]